MTELPPDPPGNGFLARLIERASERDGGVAPRLPSLYEPPAPQLTWAVKPLAGATIDGGDNEGLAVEVDGFVPSPTIPAGTEAPHSQRVQDPAPAADSVAVAVEHAPAHHRPKTPAWSRNGAEAATALPPETRVLDGPRTRRELDEAGTRESGHPVGLVVASRAADPSEAAAPPSPSVQGGSGLSVPPTVPSVFHPTEPRHPIEPRSGSVSSVIPAPPTVRPAVADRSRRSHPPSHAVAPSLPPHPADLPPPASADAARPDALLSQRKRSEAPTSGGRLSDERPSPTQITTVATPSTVAAVVVETAATRARSIDSPVGRAPETPPATTVNISIGRVEVRAVPAASPPRAGRRDSGRPSPTLSLEEYLARRAGAQ